MCYCKSGHKKKRKLSIPNRVLRRKSPDYPWKRPIHIRPSGDWVKLVQRRVTVSRDDAAHDRKGRSRRETRFRATRAISKQELKAAKETNAWNTAGAQSQVCQWPSYSWRRTPMEGHYRHLSSLSYYWYCCWCLLLHSCGSSSSSFLFLRYSLQVHRARAHDLISCLESANIERERESDTMVMVKLLVNRFVNLPKEIPVNGSELAGWYAGRWIGAFSESDGLMILQSSVNVNFYMTNLRAEMIWLVE